MNLLRIWLVASRLPSQSYIFLPLLVGEAVAVHQGYGWNWGIFAVVHLFGLFDQLYIVYANDCADSETDRINTTYNLFSGGSRVLVEGWLRPQQLAAAAWFMAGLSVGQGVWLGFGWGRWWAVPLILVGLLLLWLYSFPPVRLSYRGGGELLQMVGVGMILPLLGNYAQGAPVGSFPWALMAVILPTQLACAIATSLPDAPSDRKSNKRTVAVLLGLVPAKMLIVTLNLISIAALSMVFGRRPGMLSVSWVTLLPLGATLAQLFFFRSKPGSRGLNVQVFFAVLVTLSLMVALATVLWCDMGVTA